MKKLFFSIFAFLVLVAIAYAGIHVDGNDLFFSGNMSGNVIYGGMWNFSENATAWTFSLNNGIYENLTGLDAGEMNGITVTCNTRSSGGCFMTIPVSGVYNVNMAMSYEPLAGGALISVAVVEDFNVANHYDCYSRRTATVNQVGNVGVFCRMDLEAGDSVNIQVENEQNSNDIKVHSVNLILTRVGNYGS